jgi:hypothetical protein
LSRQASSRHVKVTKLKKIKRLVVIQDAGATPLKAIVSRDFDAAIADFRQAVLIHIGVFLSLERHGLPLRG